MFNMTLTNIHRKRIRKEMHQNVIYVYIWLIALWETIIFNMLFIFRIMNIYNQKEKQYVSLI